MCVVDLCDPKLENSALCAICSARAKMFLSSLLLPSPIFRKVEICPRKGLASFGFNVNSDESGVFPSTCRLSRIRLILRCGGK